VGLTDKVSQLADSVQDGVKKTSTSLLTLTLKLFSVAILGLTFALIGQEIAGYATFMFIFVGIVVATLFFKIIQSLTLSQVFLFDLFCILVGLVLRMYILIAP
jgi:hypothetical protein